MDEKVSVETLRQIKKIFDKHGIEFWLNSGTLLGAVRDGKLIPWDGDIDLGAWFKDFDKIAFVGQTLHDKGFEIHFSLSCVEIVNCMRGKKCIISVHAYHTDGDQAVSSGLVHPGEQYHSANGEIRVDIIKRKIKLTIKYFIWLLSAPTYIGDGPKFISKKMHSILANVVSSFPAFYRYWFTNFLRKAAINLGYIPIHTTIPLRYFKELPTINFYGMEFKAPSQIEEYLEYRYGKDWRIPKRNYIWYEEDGMVRK